MMHNGRVDRLAHQITLIFATFSDNDGSNIFCSIDSLSLAAHAMPKEIEAALKRLESGGVITPSSASNGAPGWRLNVGAELSGENAISDRQRRERAAAAERSRRYRKNKTASGEAGDRHAQLTRDVTGNSPVTVTPNSPVTPETVTPNSTERHAQVTRGVTGDSTERHAQVTVTTPGQTPYTSNDLHNDLHRTSTVAFGDSARASEPIDSIEDELEQGELIHFPASPTPDSEEEFARWYAKYPRRVGRKPALNHWPVAVKKAGLEKLHEALTAHCEYWRREQRPVDKIPHPSTWLNQERWKDELTVPSWQSQNGHGPYRNPDPSLYYGAL